MWAMEAIIVADAFDVEGGGSGWDGGGFPFYLGMGVWEEEEYILVLCVVVVFGLCFISPLNVRGMLSM